MSDQRGVTIIEALVASVVVAFAGLALTSFYLAMVNSFAWAQSETVLQRQGSLVLDVIGRQSRRASSVAAGCAPAGSVGDSLQVTVSAPLSGAGTYCYYAGTGANGAVAGALCERFTPAAGAAGSCRDLLDGQGGLARRALQSRLTLLHQTNPVDPTCPRRSAPGQPLGVPLAATEYCLVLASSPSVNGVEVGFTIGDGMASRQFAATFNLRN
jgi:Tfp pilus assembly protein PilW